jgi:LysR family hydrogen peroxide-inducible transcriptional activator
MFLTNFIKKISQSKTHYRGIEYRRNIVKLNNGHLDAAIAATLLEDKIKKSFLLRTFCGIHSRKSSSFSKEEIEIEDLNIDEILLLQDGHCFRDGILNL